MTAVATRATVGALALALLAAGPVAAQRPGQNASTLPPHVQQQLWPERPLSPPEQELKDRVIVARDSITRIEASVALLERQQRSNGSPAVFRSTARALADECGRGARVAKWLGEFAVTLSTSDPKWGDPSVRAYRTAIGHFEKGMTECQAAIGSELDRPNPDHARLGKLATSADLAVAEYRRAEEGLLRTLKIRVDPKQPAASTPS